MSNVHILSHQNLDLWFSYLHLWRHTGWKANCILMEWIYDKQTFIIHVDNTNDRPFTYWPWTLGFIKHVSIVFVTIYGTLGAHPINGPPPPILGMLVLFFWYTQSFPILHFCSCHFFNNQRKLSKKIFTYSDTKRASYVLFMYLFDKNRPPPQKKGDRPNNILENRRQRLNSCFDYWIAQDGFWIFKKNKMHDL